jgi:hypothetical protein
MMNSVIYSAVMASIFVKLPFLTVRLAIFDTSLGDLSEYLEDPVGILMKVQLGGGTDIAGALEYAKKLTALGAPHSLPPQDSGNSDVEPQSAGLSVFAACIRGKTGEAAPHVFGIREYRETVL